MAVVSILPNYSTSKLTKKQNSNIIKVVVEKLRYYTVEVCYFYNCSFWIFGLIMVILIVIGILFVKFLLSLQFVGNETKQQLIKIRGQLICCTQLSFDDEHILTNKKNNLMNNTKITTATVSPLEIFQLNNNCKPALYIAISLYDYNWSKFLTQLLASICYLINVLNMKLRFPIIIFKFINF